MVTAKFGSKKFQVKSKMIYTPNDTSIGESLNIEETERSGKKPTISIKGIKLQTLSFKVQLDARFVTVATEVRWWKNKLLSKKSEVFYLGDYKVGKFVLSDYSVSDIAINKNGTMTKATLSLSFTEDAGTTKATSKTTKTNASASSVKKSTTTKKSTTSSAKKTSKESAKKTELKTSIKNLMKNGSDYKTTALVSYKFTTNTKIMVSKDIRAKANCRAYSSLDYIVTAFHKKSSVPYSTVPYSIYEVKDLRKIEVIYKDKLGLYKTKTYYAVKISKGWIDIKDVISVFL